MSAIVLIAVGIPAASAAWPAIAAAAVAAGSALGFAASQAGPKIEKMNEVELPVGDSSAVSDDISPGREIVLSKDDVDVIFSRDTRGRMAVKVCGSGKSEAELREIGEKMANGLTQQYAYHRLVTELKQRNFNVVDEEVEEDGTVRLQVRVFQG